MSDPYSVLGVSPNASDEEIKKAYRELARKYHPDNYQNNPLADLAEEKMKEVNEAYDAINKMRSSGSHSGGGSYGGSAYQQSGGYGYGYQQRQSSSSGALYSRVRQAINAGNIDARSQQAGNSFGPALFRQNRRRFTDTVAVPGRRHGDHARKNRRTADAAHTGRSIGHPHGVQSQSGNRTDGKPLQSADEIDFFFQSHLSENFMRLFRRRIVFTDKLMNIFTVDK